MASTVLHYTLEYRKGNVNGKAGFPPRLPQLATEHDRSGSAVAGSLDSRY